MEMKYVTHCSEIDAVSQAILVAAKCLARRRRDLSVFHLFRVLAIEISHEFTVEFLDLFHRSTQEADPRGMCTEVLENRRPGLCKRAPTAAKSDCVNMSHH